MNIELPEECSGCGSKLTKSSVCHHAREIPFLTCEEHQAHAVIALNGSLAVESEETPTTNRRITCLTNQGETVEFIANPREGFYATKRHQVETIAGDEFTTE